MNRPRWLRPLPGRDCLLPLSAASANLLHFDCHLTVNLYKANTNRLLAISDQGLYALGNLLVTIFLARHLPEAQYGCFALSQSAYFILASVHSALIIEPLLIFRQKTFQSQSGQYYAFALASSLLFSIAVLLASLVLESVLYVIHISYVQIILGINIMSLPSLLLWLLRRACFSELRPILAVRGGILYVFVSILLQFAASFMHAISLVEGYCLVAAACLPSIVLLCRQLHIRWNLDRGFTCMAMREHWSYGKWSTQTNLLLWVPSNTPQWFAAMYCGPSAAACLKVLMTPLLPYMQAVGSLSSLLIPTFSRIDSDGEVRNSVKRQLLVGFALSLCYAAPCMLFSRQIIQILFGQSYVFLSPLLPWVMLVAFSETFSCILGPYFLSRVRPKAVLSAYVVSAAFALTGGPLLIRSCGLKGAVISSLMTAALSNVGLFAQYYFSAAHLRNRSGSHSAGGHPLHQI